MPADEVVSRDVAEAEFDRFCEEMDLDVDESVMDDDDRKSLAKARNKFVRAVMRGKLTVGNGGVPTYTYQPDGGDEVEISFPEPKGKAFLASDRGKKDQNMGKMFLIMAAMTGKPASIFSDMPNRDVSVCMAVAQLFLG